MNLVTGATGILGSNVLYTLLKNNLPVIACKRKTSDLKKVEKLFSYYTADYKNLFLKIKWVDLDVLDIFSIEDALENITTVYHCAGFVSFNKKDKQQLFNVNEKGTANIVNACLFKKNIFLCHVSSISTINNLDYKNILNETIFWKTSGKESDYAISKYKGECEVWRGIEEGLDAVIINPGVILSSGFWEQSSSKLFSACYKGNKFYTEGSAGYVAATDVSEIMLKLVSKHIVANRYIIIENNYSFQIILDAIQTQFKKPIPTIKISKFLLHLIRFGNSFLTLFSNKQQTITKSLVRSAYNNQVFSNSKILTDLDYNFTPAKQVITQICLDYLNDKKAKV